MINEYVKQLREVRDDIERLESGNFSWFTPNFYYGTDNETEILIIAKELEKSLINELDKLTNLD